MTTERIDVLAVMSELRATLPESSANLLWEARTKVAEALSALHWQAAYCARRASENTDEAILWLEAERRASDAIAMFHGVRE